MAATGAALTKRAPLQLSRATERERGRLLPFAFPFLIYISDMHLEQLSKSQIVLLTLLVSFVTSIATGIVTVSLMEQAPPAVAQTVNRVIERTVEKVVPGGQAAATVITREKTVVVKESELISQAVDRAVPAMVRIYDESGESSIFLGLGIVLDAVGLVASDAGALDERSDAIVALADGTRLRAFVTARDNSSGLVFLNAATSTDEGKAPAFKPAVLSGSRPVLGQTIISLAGEKVTRIGNGIVTAIVPIGGKSGKTVIETTVPENSVMKGSILVNTDGQVVGISTAISRDENIFGFMTSSALTE